MAVIKGEAQAVRKVVPTPKAITPGPQNVGLPGYRPGDAGNPYQGVNNPAINPQAIAGYIAPAAAAPAPAPAPPAPPPPIDWEKLISDDSEGKLQHTYLDRQNTLTTAALRQAWLGNTQGSQDSYNAHGALFSGAAANAQVNLGEDYKRQQAQQALDYDKGGHDIYNSVAKRLRDLMANPDGLETT